MKEGAVEYKRMDHYSNANHSTSSTTTMADVKADRRYTIIKQYIDGIIQDATIPDLCHMSTTMQDIVLESAMRVIGRCLLHSPHVKKRTPYHEQPERFALPRDNQILAIAALLLAGDNLRQTSGADFGLHEKFSADIMIKANRLKVNIETSSLLNIFDGSVLRMASCIEKIQHRMLTCCSAADINYNVIIALRKRLEETINDVTLNGKNSSHLTGAVIIHCLGDCSGFEHKIVLSEHQIDTICSRLSLTKRALMTHTKQLRAICRYCKQPE
jgi:hypothetical protein